MGLLVSIALTILNHRFNEPGSTREWANNSNPDQSKKKTIHILRQKKDWVGGSRKWPDKSPKVPFHTITLSYSYFEEFEFWRQFSKKQNMIKEKYQLNENEKFVDKAQQCFAFLYIKPNFKFAVQWSWFLEM